MKVAASAARAPSALTPSLTPSLQTHAIHGRDDSRRLSAVPVPHAVPVVRSVDEDDVPVVHVHHVSVRVDSWHDVGNVAPPCPVAYHRPENGDQEECCCY